MYTSKYYTCEQIDQRLLQGYFDDFVQAGFVGTLSEFQAFVLSIKDKIDKKDFDAAKKELEDKLAQDLENLDLDTKLKKVKKNLKKKIQAVQDAIPTKVSELQNDADYQTKEQVEKFISDLVDGADKSMDTLKELADALNNDPNFAANVINLITNLRTELEAEIKRAEQSDNKFIEDLKEEIKKREDGDQNILNLINDFNDRILKLQENLGNLQNELTQKLNEYEQKLHSLEDKMGEESSRIEGLIDQEAQARKDGDQGIKDKLVELEQNLNNKDLASEQLHRDLETKIQLEAAARESGDNQLQSALQEEATNRAADKSELLSKLSEEVNNRINGDAELKTKLEAETKSREADIKKVNADLEIEAANRENADRLLKSEIDNLKDNTEGKVKDLSDKLDQELSSVKESLDNKVDKREGYGLSKNDLTDELFDKLVNLDRYANYITKVSELENDLGFQTLEDVKAEIEKVIDAAPDALNTLKELADALDNDPNFAATITNKLTQLAVQLNKEVEDREKADKAITEAYTLAIQGAVNNLQAALTVLEGTVNNNYRELSKDIANLQNDQDDLDAKIDSTKEELLEKVRELRTNVTEQINGLNTKWVEFKSSVEGQISDQNAKISANTAAIQTNLELIQALQKQYAEIPNNMQALINAEAEIRRASDDAIRAQITLVDQKLIQEVSDRKGEITRLETQMKNDKLEVENKIDKVKEDLEDLVKKTSNVAGSESIDVTKVAKEDGTQESKVSVIVKQNDTLLSIGPDGVQSELTIEKAETEEEVTYTIKGKDEQVIQVLNVPKKMGDDFTEEDAENLYNEVYGEEFNPDAPGALVGMSPEEAEAIYNEIYNKP